MVNVYIGTFDFVYMLDNSRGMNVLNLMTMLRYLSTDGSCIVKKITASCSFKKLAI